jgi:Circularly permutated YpsA SLOG family
VARGRDGVEGRGGGTTAAGLGNFIAAAVWTCTSHAGILCAMITLVISGGQTGADQAGWRAAQAGDIPTGGWMPKGFLTEEGPQRWLANVYGAREMPTKSYPARMVQNVKDSDGTL